MGGWGSRPHWSVPDSPSGERGGCRDKSRAGKNPDTSGSGPPDCGQRLAEAISGGGHPTLLRRAASAPLGVRGSRCSPEPPRAGQRSPTLSMKGRKRVWAASQKQFHLKCYRKIIYGSFWKTQLSGSHSLWVPDGRGSAVTAGARAAGARSSKDEASRAARVPFPQRMAGGTSGCSGSETHVAAPALPGTCLHLHPPQDQRSRLRQEPLTIWAPQSAPLSGVCFYYKYFIV